MSTADSSQSTGRWLISYAARRCTRLKDGRCDFGQIVDYVALSDEHPAAWAAHMRRDKAEWDDRREGSVETESHFDDCDDLIRVYSAIPVPAGLLTAEKEEWLE